MLRERILHFFKCRRERKLCCNYQTASYKHVLPEGTKLSNLHCWLSQSFITSRKKVVMKYLLCKELDGGW